MSNATSRNAGRIHHPAAPPAITDLVRLARQGAWRLIRVLTSPAPHGQLSTVQSMRYVRPLLALFRSQLPVFSHSTRAFASTPIISKEHRDDGFIPPEMTDNIVK